MKKKRAATLVTNILLWSLPFFTHIAPAQRSSLGKPKCSRWHQPSGFCPQSLLQAEVKTTLSIRPYWNFWNKNGLESVRNELEPSDWASKETARGWNKIGQELWSVQNGTFWHARSSSREALSPWKDPYVQTNRLCLSRHQRTQEAIFLVSTSSYLQWYSSISSTLIFSGFRLWKYRSIGGCAMNLNYTQQKTVNSQQLLNLSFSPQSSQMGCWQQRLMQCSELKERLFLLKTGLLRWPLQIPLLQGPK